MELFLKALALLLSCVLVDQMVLAQTGLLDTEKQVILDAHNFYRGQVVPTAANMEKMVTTYSYLVTWSILPSN